MPTPSHERAAKTGQAQDRRKGQTRRRGEALEIAIMQACWDVVAEHGYAGLTIQRIAKAADTSRSVIYRRWMSLADLLEETLVWQHDINAVSPTNTGDLRTDLIVLLTAVSDNQRNFAYVATVQLAEYYRTTGKDFSDIRDLVIKDNGYQIGLAPFKWAAERGEIDLEKIPERVLRAASNLVRSEIFVSPRMGVSPNAIVEIVDQIVLPLLQYYREHPIEAASNGSAG